MKERIYSILENKQKEDEQIEYKDMKFENGKFSSLKEKSKLKICKEIVAFANNKGGTLIIGVSENSKHNFGQIEDTGVTKENFEQWEQSFRQYINSKIKPRLDGLKVGALEIYNKNIIYISVSRGLNRPYVLNDGNKEEFYIRNGNICSNMLRDDIKEQFQNSYNIKNRVKSFINERIELFYTGEILEGIENSSALMIHIMPSISMEEFYIDINKYERDPGFEVFNNYGADYKNLAGESIIYNVDGVMKTNSSYGDEPPRRYSQLFRTGVIEIVELDFMNKFDENLKEYTIYKWDNMEELIYKSIGKTIERFSCNNILGPYYVSVALLNVKGKKTKIGIFNDYSTPINRNTIKSQQITITSFHKDIEPLLDNLAQIFGQRGKLNEIKS